MEVLRLKQEVDFEKHLTFLSTMSVCLRGARRFNLSDEFDLSIYTPDFQDQPKAIANIVSQNHYCFYNLMDEDYEDNYDQNARTHGGLYKAMVGAYPDFKDREIVTILRFSIK
jgi:hypothetical protein